jgi:hypothetical protein
MKLALMSDLHFEFHMDGGIALINEIIEGLPNDLDVIALAGDIGLLKENYEEIKTFLLELSHRAKHVVYVPGNHEFYHDYIGVGLKKLLSLQGDLQNKNIDIVYDACKTYCLGQYTILSGTLWFENLYPGRHVQELLNDFNCIKELESTIYKFNSRFKAKFLEFNTDNLICITHHSPTFGAVPPKYLGSAINQFFCNNMDEEISIIKPKLWCFGHLHDSVDMKIGETRIVNNPLGYPHEGKYNWKPLIIEV